MKIIKRSGAEVDYDITKIIAAVQKANESVPAAERMTQEQILKIADNVHMLIPSRCSSTETPEVVCIRPDCIRYLQMYHSADRPE